VAEAIRRCWQNWCAGTSSAAHNLERFERQNLTKQLADLLDQVLEEVH
jgi:hypothetical protein